MDYKMKSSIRLGLVVIIAISAIIGSVAGPSIFIKGVSSGIIGVLMGLGTIHITECEDE